MSIRHTARHALLAAALAVPATHAAAQSAPVTHTFESGTVGTGSGFGAGDYQFENFGVATTDALGTGANASSGVRFALGRTTSSFLYRDTGNFYLLGASLSYRAFDDRGGPLELVLRGYRSADPSEAPSFVRTLTLTSTAQWFDFGLALGAVNEIEFDTGAFTADGRQAALALDDVTLATVPEPASVALLATGLGAVLLVGARRRTRG